MDALGEAVVDCLENPASYRQHYGDRQNEIVGELYARPSIGRAAKLQVARLIELAR